MADKRRIEIGALHGSSVYFLPDATGVEKNALIADAEHGDSYTDILSVLMNGNIIKKTDTDFQKFLWSMGQGNESDKWRRIFINRTQPVGSEMVAKDEYTKSPKAQAKIKNVNNRAISYKSLTVSNHFQYMPHSSLNRTGNIIGKRLRTGMNNGLMRGIDGDGDGFVDDGLPTMRPFIPGFDIIPDSLVNAPARTIGQMRSRQMVRSVQGMRMQAGESVADRAIPVAATFISERMKQQFDLVNRKYNGNMPIRTKGDIRNILSRDFPLFRSGEMIVDFLESGDDSEIMNPTEREIMYALLLAHAGNRDLSKFPMVIEKFRIGSTSGYEAAGMTRYQYGTQWGSTPGPGGLLQPVLKKQRLLRNVVYYRQDSHPANSTRIDSLIATGRFDVGGNLLMAGMLEDIIKNESASVKSAIRNYLDAGKHITNLAEILDQIKKLVSLPEDAPLGPHISPIATAEQIQDINMVIESIVRSAEGADQQIKQILSKELSIKSISSLIDVLKNKREMYKASLGPKFDTFMNMANAANEVLVRSVNFHEFTHAIHAIAQTTEVERYMGTHGLSTQNMWMVPLVMFGDMGVNELQQRLIASMDHSAQQSLETAYALLRQLFIKAQSSSNPALPISALRKFLEQPVLDKNGKPILITKSMEKVLRLNPIKDTALGFTSHPKSGEPLTLGQVIFSLTSDVLATQRNDARISNYAGRRLTRKAKTQGQEVFYNDKDVISLIREFGYPHLVSFGDSHVPSKDDGEIWADAAVAVASFVNDLVQTAQSSYQLSSVQYVSALRMTGREDRRISPTERGIYLDIDTTGELISPTASPQDAKIKNDLVQTLIGMTASFYDYILQMGDDKSAGTFIESRVGAHWELDHLTNDEKDMVINLVRLSGAPGYRNYMGTAVTSGVAAFGEWRLSYPGNAELLAELATYDAFGIPLSVFDPATGKHRILTKKEIDILNKLLDWIFPDGRISRQLGVE